MSPWWWPIVGVIALVALLFLFATGCAVVGAYIEYRRSEQGRPHGHTRKAREKGIV